MWMILTCIKDLFHKANASHYKKIIMQMKPKTKVTKDQKKFIAENHPQYDGCAEPSQPFRPVPSLPRQNGLQKNKKIKIIMLLWKL